jgi:ankyrin repeat protein
MALELSKQAYALCSEKDASGLRAFLEEHSADIDLYLHEQKEYDTRTFNIMGLAAHHESPECLQVLLDFGADVNNRECEHGISPLMRAAGFGRVECMRLLLEKKADVATTCNNGGTALISASYEGHSECLRLLIESNADVDCKNEDGDTGLIVAAGNGHAECVSVLIEANADVNQPGLGGWTWFLWACEKGNLECLRLLIMNNADVDYKTENGETGLIVASENGHPECVKVLIEAKADVNQRGLDGRTGVHWASQDGNLECLRLLIMNNADVDCKTEGGDTGLMAAVYRGHSECMEVLIEASADVDCKNTYGNTALTLAIAHKYFNYLMLLLDHGDGGTPASADTKAHALGAVLESKEDLSGSAAFMLLAHGADIDAAAEQISENKRSAASMYANTHLFIERWHEIALNALSERVEVDRRVGLGLHGLYQEPLERVLQYLGLSMSADQVVNHSLDAGARRVLLPNCARNADDWLQQSLN